MKKPSIKDIALKAGVSPSTVSSVLNGKAKHMRISDVVAARVKKIALDEGYQPNTIAVSLRIGRSKIIGLIVEDIANPFFSALARTIEDEALKLGYRIVYCSTENDLERGNDLLFMLGQTHVDGYIITPVPGMELKLKELKDQGRPMVFMDRFIASLEVPCVLINNYDGVKQGMDYLLKRGYNCIGYVSTNSSQVQMKARMSAYIDKVNTDLQKAPLLLEIDFLMDRTKIKAAVKEFVIDNNLDAVFFATNYLGVVGLEIINELGWKIPDQIGIVCFDDTDLFKLYPPGITAVRQPVQEIAEHSVKMLIDQIQGKLASSESQLLLKGELMVRGSA